MNNGQAKHPLCHHCSRLILATHLDHISATGPVDITGKHTASDKRSLDRWKNSQVPPAGFDHTFTNAPPICSAFPVAINALPLVFGVKAWDIFRIYQTPDFRGRTYN